MDLEALKIDRSADSGRARRRRRRGGLGWIVVLAVAAIALWLFRAPLVRTLDGWRLTHVRTLRVVATSPAAAAAVSGTAANGYVVARTRAALSADTPGRIVELNVSEGSVVKQGDVVARLYFDEVESQQRLDQTRATEEQAQARLDATRAQERSAATAAEQAVQRQGSSEAALAEARARVTSLEARRDQAAATLDKTYVRAPFDGVVVLKDAEVGEVVSPNSQGAQSRGSVATMVDFQSLEVQVELPETSLDSVHVDQAATIFLDAFPGDGYAARTLRIWPTANRQKGTVEVRVGFERIDDRLRPEMGARVVFRADSSAAEAPPDADAGPALRIPSSSVVRVDGRRGVFVVERSVVGFRAIEVGGEKSDRVLVTSGLTEGEHIVVEPPTSLEDGERVFVEGNP